MRKYLFDTTILVLIYFLFFFKRWKRNLYLQTVNFIPFVDIIKNHQGAVREVFLNVLMLMP